MFKKIPLPLFLFVCTVGMGQPGQSGDEALVRQLIIDCFQEVWSDLDSTKLTKYHTEDYILLEDGEIWNNDTIKNYMRRALIPAVRSTRENRFEFIKAEKYGNAIWIAYENWATWSFNGEVNGRALWLESAVAVETPEGWKIKMLHSTRIREE